MNCEMCSQDTNETHFHKMHYERGGMIYCYHLNACEQCCSKIDRFFKLWEFQLVKAQVLHGVR